MAALLANVLPLKHFKLPASHVNTFATNVCLCGFMHMHAVTGFDLIMTSHIPVVLSVHFMWEWVKLFYEKMQQLHNCAFEFLSVCVCVYRRHASEALKLWVILK